jgi:hypothetical protein
MRNPFSHWKIWEPLPNNGWIHADASRRLSLIKLMSDAVLSIGALASEWDSLSPELKQRSSNATP